MGLVLLFFSLVLVNLFGGEKERKSIYKKQAEVKLIKNSYINMKMNMNINFIIFKIFCSKLYKELYTNTKNSEKKKWS